MFVQNPYLGTIYIESIFEEDIDLKNQFRIKILPDPTSIREPATENYVDNFFNDPNIIKNTTHVDFNDRDLNIVHSIKISTFATLEEQLTPKYYVDQAISIDVDESSLLRLDPNEKLKLDEQDSIILNSNLTLPKTIKKLPTKVNVDNLFNDPSITKNTVHINLNDRNITNARFIHVNQWPQIDSHLTRKLYVDIAIDEQSLVRKNQNDDFILHILTNKYSFALKRQAENDK